jgi:tetratricopeptide (TPR) repeat protein
MKNTLYLFLFIFQISLAQTAFEKGNVFYQKEHYQAAITSYESILESGKHSSDLYFNLGNCYYKLHKVAPAIYNFEKALLLNPNDKDIQTNLGFAQKMAIDDIKVIPKVGFNKLIQDFTSNYHYDTWAWIAVSFAFIFLLFFIGYYFSQTTLLKRIFFLGMFVLLLAIVVSVSSGIYEKMHYENEKPAIVFSEIVSVKSEPKNTSPDAFVLHEGTKVYILESIANWKKIELTDETTGWIEADAVKELK